MSYEEDYRKPYKSICACGQGFLRFYRIVESNEWGQEKAHNTKIEIHCDYCQEHYYYKMTDSCKEGLLIPKGLSYPKKVPNILRKNQFTSEESFVGKHCKSVIEAMIDDMTTHRYMKDLTYRPAILFADSWVLIHGKKSLTPMVAHLRTILSNYDILLSSYNEKKPIVEAYNNRITKRNQEIDTLEMQSFRPVFSIDKQQEQIDLEQLQKELADKALFCQHDSFNAYVTYHQTFKKSLIGHFWDTLSINECVDPQYLVLEKPIYGIPRITIVKKYRCVCSICGKELIVNSSDFEILNSDSKGYYPKVFCSCHTISSAEAKTMDILNHLGVNYTREISFEDLIGKEKPLRFDFAVYENKDAVGNPEYCLILELHGPHHYKPGYYDEFGEFIIDATPLGAKKYSQQIQYDKQKAAFCAKNNIPLECITLSSKSSYEELKRKIRKILKKYKIAF